MERKYYFWSCFSGGCGQLLDLGHCRKNALLFACELLCRSSEEPADFDHFRIQIPREPRGPLRHLVTRRVDSALHRCRRRRRCAATRGRRTRPRRAAAPATHRAPRRKLRSRLTPLAPAHTPPGTTTGHGHRSTAWQHEPPAGTRQRRLPTSAPARRRTGGRHDQRESHQRRVPTRAVNFISPTHHPKTGKLTLSNSNRAIYIVTARNRKGFSQ